MPWLVSGNCTGPDAKGSAKPQRPLTSEGGAAAVAACSARKTTRKMMVVVTFEQASYGSSVDLQKDVTKTPRWDVPLISFSRSEYAAIRTRASPRDARRDRCRPNLPNVHKTHQEHQELMSARGLIRSHVTHQCIGLVNVSSRFRPLVQFRATRNFKAQDPGVGTIPGIGFQG